jgi:two-component system, OmpR family, sensor histidine kinase ArlS
MTLKSKLSLFTSILFSVMYGISAIVIYLLFSDFRQDEFENRLKEKAYSSIRLLVDVKEVDKNLLKDIDRHTLNQLYDEKTLIFDDQFNLIYSSLDDSKIEWTVDDLKYLKQHQTFFKKEGKYEIYGVYYDSNFKDYYALISASDNYGKRKLEFLIYVLLSTYIGFTLLCWFATSYVVQRLLKPLDSFHNKIKVINESSLDARIQVSDTNNEIDLIGKEFNSMLERIALSYQKQKEFTSHASHELRTPIARLSAVLENKLMQPEIGTVNRSFIQGLLDDLGQISELISSLLLLARLNNASSLDTEGKFRIDEIIYDCFSKIQKQNAQVRLNLNIDENEAVDDYLEISGSRSLLEITFSNLLKNAFAYSDNQQANISISQMGDKLIVRIENNGATLDFEEQNNLFQAFMRGQNATNKTGLGLGLLIVHRIVIQHRANIRYYISEFGNNVFEIEFEI